MSIESQIGYLISQKVIEYLAKRPSLMFIIRDHIDGKEHMDIVLGDENYCIDLFTTSVRNFNEFINTPEKEFLGIGKERNGEVYFNTRIGKINKEDTYTWINRCRGKAYMKEGKLSFRLKVTYPIDLKGKEFKIWAFDSKDGKKQWVML